MVLKFWIGNSKTKARTPSPKHSAMCSARRSSWEKSPGFNSEGFQVLRVMTRMTSSGINLDSSKWWQWATQIFFNQKVVRSPLPAKSVTGQVWRATNSHVCGTHSKEIAGRKQSMNPKTWLRGYLFIWPCFSWPEWLWDPLLGVCQQGGPFQAFQPFQV